MNSKTKEQHDEVMKLKAEGYRVVDIVNKTGLTRSCINNWVNRGSKIHNEQNIKPKLTNLHPIEYLNSLNKEIEQNLRYSLYSYILGLYLGDGCIGELRKTKRLAISLDKKYPKLNEFVWYCMKTLFNKNPYTYDRSINRGQKHISNSIDISICSTNLGVIFPHEGRGAKHLRKIELQEWQLNILDHVHFVKGLIHSDGSYFYCKTFNTFNYTFSNCSVDICGLLMNSLKILEISYNHHQKKKISEKGTVLKNCVNVNRKNDVEKLHSLIGDKTNIVHT
jgi:hypothetical protein